MNKQYFLKSLDRQLNCVRKEERKKYIEYYEEMISDIMESGVSEEEAIRRQGQPKQIARDILSNINPAHLKTRDWQGLTLVLLSVFLLLASVVAGLLQWQFEKGKSASIDIIGGADGPTSIVLAGELGKPWGIYFATAVLVVVTMVYFIRKRKR